MDGTARRKMVTSVVPAAPILGAPFLQSAAGYGRDARPCRCELIYTNSYYYIGHFSKFVRPGAKRIASSPSRSQLPSAAFLNPDGKVSVVVMNKSDKKISYYLWLDGNAAEVSSLPHSIQTLVF